MYAGLDGDKEAVDSVLFDWYSDSQHFYIDKFMGRLQPSMKKIVFKPFCHITIRDKKNQSLKN